MKKGAVVSRRHCEKCNKITTHLHQALLFEPWDVWDCQTCVKRAVAERKRK